MPLKNGKIGKQKLKVSPTRQDNNMHQTISQDELVKYLHTAALSLVVSTWIKYIEKGFLVTRPGLMVKKVKKYPLKSEARALGHLDQSQKNQISMTQKTAQNQDVYELTETAEI